MLPSIIWRKEGLKHWQEEGRQRCVTWYYRGILDYRVRQNRRQLRYKVSASTLAYPVLTELQGRGKSWVDMSLGEKKVSGINYSKTGRLMEGKQYVHTGRVSASVWLCQWPALFKPALTTLPPAPSCCHCGNSEHPRGLSQATQAMGYAPGSWLCQAVPCHCTVPEQHQPHPHVWNDVRVIASNGSQEVYSDTSRQSHLFCSQTAGTLNFKSNLNVLLLAKKMNIWDTWGKWAVAFGALTPHFPWQQP